MRAKYKIRNTPISNIDNCKPTIRFNVKHCKNTCCWLVSLFVFALSTWSSLSFSGRLTSPDNFLLNQFMKTENVDHWNDFELILRAISRFVCRFRCVCVYFFAFFFFRLAIDATSHFKHHWKMFTALCSQNSLTIIVLNAPYRIIIDLSNQVDVCSRPIQPKKK